MNSKLKRFAANAGLSCITGLILLGLLEIVLRSTHLFGARTVWSQPDPVLAARFVPHSAYWDNKENDHPITGTINRFGWRDTEWALSKPDDVYRIAVLGDSYVEAFQVELDSTFLKRAERDLNDTAHKTVELMNFGRSGFTQTEELIVLQQDVVPFSPDMVIVCFLPGNDIADVRKQTAPHHDRPFYEVSSTGALVLDTRFTNTWSYKIRSLINPFQRRSFFISLIAERYTALTLDRAQQTFDQALQRRSRPDRLSGYLSLCTQTPDTAFSKSYAFSKHLIGQMAGYCKDRGIRFLLLCLNDQTYKPEAEAQYAHIDSTFDAYFFEDDLQRYADSLHVDFLGLQRVFRQAYMEKGEALHWGHWNYLGHRVVAGALSEKLRGILHDQNP